MAALDIVDLDAVLDELEGQSEEEDNSAKQEDTFKVEKSADLNRPQSFQKLNPRSISDDVILESPDKHSSSSDQFYDVPESPRLATSAEDGEKISEPQPGISNSQELVRDTLPPATIVVPDSTTGQVGHNQPDVLPIVHRGATVVHQESQPEQPINQTCPLTSKIDTDSCGIPSTSCDTDTIDTAIVSGPVAGTSNSSNCGLAPQLEQHQPLPPSPVHESIYDRYKSTKESSEEASNEDEPSKSISASESVPLGSAPTNSEGTVDQLSKLSFMDPDGGAGESWGARPKESRHPQLTASSLHPDVVIEARSQQTPNQEGQFKDLDGGGPQVNEHHSMTHHEVIPSEPSDIGQATLVTTSPDNADHQSKESGVKPSEGPQDFTGVEEISQSDIEEVCDRPSAPIADDSRSGTDEHTDMAPSSEDMPDPVTGASKRPAPTMATEIPALLAGLSEEQLMLGKVSPFWIPDSDATLCMNCGARFTVVKRRHHCRACGKVFCAVCCSGKLPMQILDGKEGRVCLHCKPILERLQEAEKMQQQSQPEAGADNNEDSADGAVGGVDPSAPSAPPPHPVPGVLKRSESNNSSMSGADPKQVMFSDGVKPGGDLAELDGSADQGHRPPRRSSSSTGSSSGSSGGRSGRKHSKGHSGSHRSRVLTPEMLEEMKRSFIPCDALPPTATSASRSGAGNVDLETLMHKFQQGGSPVVFLLGGNLRVHVTLLKSYSPINKPVWNFRTQGLAAVGQDEVVILLIKLEGESLPARNIFEHLQHLYEQASNGNSVGNMGHSVILSGDTFLGSQDYGGFLYFRHSYQCLEGLDLPENQPFLFAVLLSKWEMPWAKVFPLRLLLRLGAESRYYPAPLWSIRGRKTVYRHVGNTIMKLLSDFRNFTYSLPIIRGLVIHMEEKLTTVIIPKSSFPHIQRALTNSNDPVLALGGNFSAEADSHLVAVQRDESAADAASAVLNTSDYQTQAINIANKPRAVTGASFIVLNGALKSATGLTAKSSIIEDGIMVQVTQDRMMEIRQQLSKMEDVSIGCGPVSSPDPDETVHIKWSDAQASGQASGQLNNRVKSLVDGRQMDAITSVRIAPQAGRDIASKHHALRWTEVFLIPNSSASEVGSPDPTRVAAVFAKAVSVAMVPHLKSIKHHGLSPFGVKISLDPENTGYEAGSKGTALPSEFLTALDNELVPLIHGQSAPTTHSFELVFHVLDI